MRRVSMATRDELIAGLAKRYSEVGRMERSRILDEFVAVTGYHRKHAMRILRGGATSSRCQPRPGRRVYGEEVRQAIILLWETSDRVCGKRLKALLPVLVEAMERHGRLKLDPVVRAGAPGSAGCRGPADQRHGGQRQAKPLAQRPCGRNQGPEFAGVEAQARSAIKGAAGAKELAGALDRVRAVGLGG